MARIWSEEGKLDTWLEVELAALDAWAELGSIPAEAVAEMPEGQFQNVCWFLQPAACQ